METFSHTVLRAMLPVGATILPMVTRVNQSGTARWMRVVACDNGAPTDVTRYVADVLGYRVDNDGAMYVRGTGMDMRFKITSDLARTLWWDSQAFRWAA